VSYSSTLSADRALAILELLVQEAHGASPGPAQGQSTGVSLSQVAQRLDLPLSTTHRLLGALVSRHYARQNPVTEHYEATLSVAALGLRLLANTGLSDVYQPILDDLAEATGELVRLAVLEGGNLIWISKAQGARSAIRYDPVSGRHAPLHATAMGKAWLATLPEQEAVRIVTAAGFTGATGRNAVTTEAGLRAELRKTREQGYGLVDEEADPGISAIAMVVRDASGPGRPVVGCVSIGGPTFRLSHERLVGFLPHLREAVERLSDLWPVRVYHTREPRRGKAV
jgi:DNA-binding IclR family transcriptional regulator